MRNLPLALIAATLWVIGACGAKAAGAPDHSDPAAVVSAIFAAASANDASSLAGLCDPEGEGDGDTKRICALATDSSKMGEFVTYFAKGTLKGAARVEGDRAEVDFLFGPDGTKPETMKLIQRDAKWYLYSF